MNKQKATKTPRASKKSVKVADPEPITEQEPEVEPEPEPEVEPEPETEPEPESENDSDDDDESDDEELQRQIELLKQQNKDKKKNLKEFKKNLTPEKMKAYLSPQFQKARQICQDKNLPDYVVRDFDNFIACLRDEQIRGYDDDHFNEIAVKIFNESNKAVSKTTTDKKTTAKKTETGEKKEKKDEHRPKTIEQFRECFKRDTMFHHRPKEVESYCLFNYKRGVFIPCDKNGTLTTEQEFKTLNNFTTNNYIEANKKREKPRVVKNDSYKECSYCDNEGVWVHCKEVRTTSLTPHTF